MNLEHIDFAESKEKLIPLIFHHGKKSAEYCPYGQISARPVQREQFGDDSTYEAYLWLIKQVDFNPLFLSVGDSEKSLRITGYSPANNRVMFSFTDIPNGIFCDYDAWENVFLHGSEEAKKQVFDISQDKNSWIHKGISQQGSVQLLVPSLDLTKASRIFVTNETQQIDLEWNGFQKRNIMLLEELWRL